MLWGLSTPTAAWVKDFYTSDLCLYEVGKKTWEICDDYIAMEGGNYELDKIYSQRQTATATSVSA